mgnify:CR=1 FL=1
MLRALVVDKVIKLVIAAIIATLIKQVLEQLIIILWFGELGVFAGLGFDVGRRVTRKKYLKEKDVLDTAEKEEAVAQAKEERKTIKIKVKK